MVEVVLAICKTLGVAAYVALLVFVGWCLYSFVRGILDPKWRKRTDADSDRFGSHF